MKYILFFFFVFTSMHAISESASLVKEKKEVIQLKKDLNQFYNKKETEYKERKKELENILVSIQKEKAAIQRIYNENLEILKDVNGVVANKTTKIFNGMKPKTASGIFNKMIEDGKIDVVFDILMKIKEKKATLIMKFLSVENAAELTIMFQNFNINKGK